MATSPEKIAEEAANLLAAQIGCTHPDPEACECGKKHCPHGEVGHFWHDGCPSCWSCEKNGGCDACRPYNKLYADALTAITQAIKEAKREERERMLGWLKEALFEEEFSKVEMIINGHLLHPAEEGEEEQPRHKHHPCNCFPTKI